MMLVVQDEPVLAALAQIDPTQSPAQLRHAVAAYLVGYPIELIERCNLPARQVRDVTTWFAAERYAALCRIVEDMGIPVH